MLQDVLAGIASIMFPRNCVVCRCGPLASREIICRSCYDKIPLLKPPVLNTLDPTGPLDHIWCVCRYEPPLRELIHRFKYKQSTRLQQLFGQILRDSITTFQLPLQQVDMLVPIPLFRSKYRERGYNQAELLARQLHLDTHIPLATDVLVRSRPTRTQTDLSVKERWTNQEGTFRITQPHGLKGRNILIIDDIMTSGATAQTAAFELKKAGASRVGLLALAKA